MTGPKLFRWTNGRRNTGYRVLTLMYSKLLRLDCYLLRYDTGSYIPRHRDPAGGEKLYRLNIEIIKARKGGVFSCEKLLWSWGRIFFFRADLSIHSVTRIEEGRRWVLSFGKLV